MANHINIIIFTFAPCNVNISTLYCTTILMKYISSIRFLCIANTKPAFLKHKPLIEIFPMIRRNISSRWNYLQRKALSLKFWLYNRNNCKVIWTSMKHWLYIRNISNKISIFLNYWFYIPNISSVIQKSQKNWI